MLCVRFMIIFLICSNLACRNAHPNPHPQSLPNSFISDSQTKIAGQLIVFGDFSGEPIDSGNVNFIPLNLLRSAELRFQGAAAEKIKAFMVKPGSTPTGIMRCGETDCQFYIHHRALLGQAPNLDHLKTPGSDEKVYESKQNFQMTLTERPEGLLLTIKEPFTAIFRIAELVSYLKGHVPDGATAPADKPELALEFDPIFMSPLRCKAPLTSSTSHADKNCRFVLNSQGEILPPPATPGGFEQGSESTPQ